MTLAILLSFVLVPAVRVLRRLRVPRAPAAAGDAADAQPETRRRQTRDRVLIDRADLEALDTDALAHHRELDDIRALLADEETAHAHTRATLEALRAEHPPF